MCRVDIMTADSNALNIAMRKSTQGPEIEIVRRFVREYKALAAERSWKHDVAIFIEPRLSTGYPDILIAHYDPNKIQSWTEARGSLSDRDLKILALLMNSGQMDASRVSYLLGFLECDVEASFEALMTCGLASLSRGQCKPAKKTSFFSLERLVSVEAKTGNALEALGQAFRNTGFSSWSYALLGNESMSQRLRNKFEALGVGAIAGGSFDEVVPPKKHKVPICQTSLRVNEWIARQIATEVGVC